MSIRSIGLFGSRDEVLTMLENFHSISKQLLNKLMDADNECLTPGIHAILPINLKRKSGAAWDTTIYLFYWHVAAASA